MERQRAGRREGFVAFAIREERRRGGSENCLSARRTRVLHLPHRSDERSARVCCEALPAPGMLALHRLASFLGFCGSSLFAHDVHVLGWNAHEQLITGFWKHDTWFAHADTPINALVKKAHLLIGGFDKRLGFGTALHKA